MPGNPENGAAAGRGEGNEGRAVILKAVTGGPDLETVRTLIREYLDFLGVDLSFQGIEAELACLPGKYGPPGGILLLASVSEPKGGAWEAAGCAGLRELEQDSCEMKRLFVRPDFRGRGIGRLLAERTILEARGLGYRSMRLDTLDRLGEAVALYRSLGFRTIPPYCENPLPGAMFWEKKFGGRGVRGQWHGLPHRTA